MDATDLQEAASLASASNAHLVTLLSAMKAFPTELMQRLIPADRAIMLGIDGAAADVPRAGHTPALLCKSLLLAPRESTRREEEGSV